MHVLEVVPLLRVAPRRERHVGLADAPEEASEEHRPPDERRAGALGELLGLRAAQVREGRREVPVDLERVRHLMASRAGRVRRSASGPAPSTCARPSTTNAGAPKMPRAMASSVRRRRSSFASGRAMASRMRLRVVPRRARARRASSPPRSGRALRPSRRGRSRARRAGRRRTRPSPAAPPRSASGCPAGMTQRDAEEVRPPLQVARVVRGLGGEKRREELLRRAVRREDAAEEHRPVDQLAPVRAASASTCVDARYA